MDGALVLLRLAVSWSFAKLLNHSHTVTKSMSVWLIIIIIHLTRRSHCLLRSMDFGSSSGVTFAYKRMGVNGEALQLCVVYKTFYYKSSKNPRQILQVKQESVSDSTSHMCSKCLWNFSSVLSPIMALEVISHFPGEHVPRLPSSCMLKHSFFIHSSHTDVSYTATVYWWCV